MRLKDVEPIIRELQNEEQYGADYYYPIELLKTAPTIEAKPVVHAHWEIEKYQAPFDDELQYKMTCSKCGYDYCSHEVYCLEYCARCGAQMDEKVGDEDDNLVH